MTVTDVSTTCMVVTFRVKVSCITSVDGIILKTQPTFEMTPGFKSFTVSDILLWKAHIVRSINQQEVKQDALTSEDPQSAILIMDWAMKFLQIKFREKQSEWFGKRGLSWHISTLTTKNVDSGKIKLKSYAHIFDSCQQDW